MSRVHFREAQILPKMNVECVYFSHHKRGFEEVK